MKDEFGTRMKLYEKVTRMVLPPRTFTIIRVDGRTFHTYLKKADKPFDQKVVFGMDYAARRLCEEISGAVFAYAQSDEISILLTDLGPRTEPWFGGSVQKMASVAASIATAAFNEVYLPSPEEDQERRPGSATFDARVYTIPSRIEVANYFLWRQKDAIRNAVSMAAHANFENYELGGLNLARQQELLFRKRGINFKTAYTDRDRRGGVVVYESYMLHRASTQHLLPDRAVREGPKLSPVERHQWTARAAPDFTLDNGGFLALQIPQEPSDALQPMVPECIHEAWEEGHGGTPYQCTDCDHVFTPAEIDARKWNTRDGV